MSQTLSGVTSYRFGPFCATARPPIRMLISAFHSPPAYKQTEVPLWHTFHKRGKKYGTTVYALHTHTHVGPLFSTHAGIDVPFPSPHYSPWGNEEKRRLIAGEGEEGARLQKWQLGHYLFMLSPQRGCQLGRGGRRIWQLPSVSLRRSVHMNGSFFGRGGT